ncbi:uncharacterized protein LOC126236198 isoform X3 [Schistocerca nitens]|uniref:uncharacterized protein LOC126236198 isoform X2 n=1 Tax=Schistocerca nitens TaxID=7011 RepID=UPI00211812A6|nr:uncharacterized protein LOC126236198 isoform X2 [Schistocerca nitens]XP_049801266.1 uncharacterized protein LOC126236198 isoform X3 [Schistocerca nitens]
MLETEAVFYINGVRHAVDSKVPVDTSLNTYIRDHANLRGTKVMCREGGCGACVVNAAYVHPFTKKKTSLAVNSCLVPVFSCHGWEITTIEGIGNRKTGYHPVQQRLAAFNGTQCGYCSPGMVMNMYSLLQTGKDMTMKEIENSFGGNICRCTGYRPILDAFKSLSIDATDELKKKCQDIEDWEKKLCVRSGGTCTQNCGQNGECSIETLAIISPVHVKFEKTDWFKVDTIADILKIFENLGDRPYMLVAGNTAHGVYRRREDIEVFIDISNVEELKSHSVTTNVTVGGNVTLNEAMALFHDLANTQKGFKYLKMIAEHIDLVANIPVRNIGTIAGNLCVKQQHNEFPSDIFIILETVGASLCIIDKAGVETVLNPPEFLKFDMTHKIIKSIILIPYDDDTYIRTYKVMPRSQNAHAYVNAGFLMKVDQATVGKLKSKPVIIFGGISPHFVHAENTEEYLNGKNLYDVSVLQEALQILDSELQLDHILPDPSPEYRKLLAQSLFYKFVLSISPENVQRTMRSGGEMLMRPVSAGKQDFDTNKMVWPLNEPIPKLEGLMQCSGEARYVNDTASIPGELFGAFVVTSVGSGWIKSTDASAALALEGVVAYYDSKDIPGKNSFSLPLSGLVTIDEEVFCSGEIKFNGQPVGIIVAESHELANRAAKIVEILYERVKKPVVTLRDALKSGDKKRVGEVATWPATDTEAKSKTKHVVKGQFDIGSQYHFTMETQSCVCIPIEDGMDIYPSTQWMDLTQIAVARVLDVPENWINIQVRRIGGAYGSKISRSVQISAACAVAAYHQNRPVRLILNIETCMESLGKRFDVALDYEAGVDDSGVITYMDAKIHHNKGYCSNENVVTWAMGHLQNAYDKSRWTISGYCVKTDLPANTYCRAPGSLEGNAMVETIMEHIANDLKMDPLEIRLANLRKDDDTLVGIINDLKSSAQYDERKKAAETFNKENRWRKRGMAMVIMRYPFIYLGNYHSVVSIYADDGTVAVIHGGVECGQGINTKVAQVCAHTLGIPLDFVSVKPSNNWTAPNGLVTGGSLASECCSYATMRSCNELLSRLAPVRDKMGKPSWKELIAQAFLEGVDLSASYMYTPKDLKPYFIYGATAAEVEVDVLTGQQQILRVDLTEDAGESLSPEIDIGQVEGAFVMGLGYWLTEKMVYDPETGKALTNRTWNYKPPGAKDIPVDFRIKLRKNAPNPAGVLRSKATGEPPICMSIALPIAIRHALNSARQDAENTTEWFQMDMPATPDVILKHSLTNYKQFKV